MRVIAIDLGARRIGVAMTDGLGLTAQPLETIPRRGGQRDLDAIAGLVRAHAAERLVIGLPLDPDGEPGRAAKSVEAFAARLRTAVTVPIDSDRRELQHRGGGGGLAGGGRVARPPTRSRR